MWDEETADHVMLRMLARDLLDGFSFTAVLLRQCEAADRDTARNGGEPESLRLANACMSFLGGHMAASGIIAAWMVMLRALSETLWKSLGGGREEALRFVASVTGYGLDAVRQEVLALHGEAVEEAVP